MQDISHHALRGYKFYLKGRDLTSVTVNDYVTMAKTFFTWCVRQELLLSDPTSKWDRTPEPRREIEVLDRTEVCAVLYRIRLVLLRAVLRSGIDSRTLPPKRLRNSEGRRWRGVRSVEKAAKAAVASVA